MLCRSKFTSKLALTLFYSDKPISPYKQEHTRCPSQPKTIKTLKTSPLLRVNRSKTNDISSNFAKLDLYGSKKRRENTKAKNTVNPAATWWQGITKTRNEFLKPCDLVGLFQSSLKMLGIKQLCIMCK